MDMIGGRSTSSRFCNAGYEVIYTGIRRSPEQIVNTAVQNDVDAIGLSVMSGAHKVQFERVISLLKGRGADRVLVFGGGLIHPDDFPHLREIGVKEIFTPGATAESILTRVEHMMLERSHARKGMTRDDPSANSGRRRGVVARSGQAPISQFPERSKTFATTSGLPVERLYLPDQDSVDRYRDHLGFPGSFPFTRGAHPTMYRSRLWTMREYAGYSTAEESNRRNRYLLSQGSTGLSIAFDLPTQIGLDSDDPLCVGEVGKVGVAINTLADMEGLFDGIPLEEVSTSMTINSPAAVLLAMYVALAEKRGLDPARLRGTIQNDILKEYLARGTYIFPPGPSLH